MPDSRASSQLPRSQALLGNASLEALLRGLDNKGRTNILRQSTVRRSRASGPRVPKQSLGTRALSRSRRDRPTGSLDLVTEQEFLIAQVKAPVGDDRVRPVPAAGCLRGMLGDLETALLLPFF